MPGMIPLYEACESLGIRPKVFRQMLAEFGDVIEGPRPRAGGGQEISAASVERMRRALQMRGNGLPAAEIRAALAAMPGAPTPAAADAASASGRGGADDDQASVAAAEAAATAVAEVPKVAGERVTGQPVATAAPAGAAAVPPASADPSPAEPLQQRIAWLEAELIRTEQRRVEDRDRILTALARAQQEIQHLRFELAAQGSRKQKRRRTIWGKIFG